MRLSWLQNINDDVERTEDIARYHRWWWKEWIGRIWLKQTEANFIYSRHKALLNIFTKYPDRIDYDDDDDDVHDDVDDNDDGYYGSKWGSCPREARELINYLTSETFSATAMNSSVQYNFHNLSQHLW